MPGMGVALEGGLGEYTTSSISLIHRSMPSKDQRLVMSYTSRIPCKASEGITRSRFPRTDGVLFRLCPAALHPHMGRAGALRHQPSCQVDTQFTQQAAMWKMSSEPSSCI